MNGIIYEFGDYLLDVGEQRLQKSGENVSLPPKVFEVLTVLVKNPKQLVSYDDLMEEIWGDTFVEETNLRYCIHSLRKTFEEDFIETVPKRGYRFNSDVQAFTTEEFIKTHTGSYKNGQIIELEKIQTASAAHSPIIKQDNKSEPTYLSSKLRPVLISVGVLTVLIGVLSYYWIYPNYFPANAINKNGNKNINLNYERVTNSGRAYFPALSKDDQKVAYVYHTADNKYGIKLQHLATKSETEILKPQTDAPFSMQFSPNGNYLFFVTINKEKGTAIYRIPIFGGEAQIIFKGLINYFSISTDGEWLAFYYPEPEKKLAHVMICRSSDGSERRIVSTRIDPYAYSVWGVYPSWSPDGRKLVSSVLTPMDESESLAGGKKPFPNKNHLVEIDIATGEEKNIKTPDWYRVAQAIWVENGNALLALVREKRGEPVQIWHLKYPSGEARNITNDTNDYRTFRPSSNLSFILAESSSHTDNLYSFPIDEPSKIRQLTFDSSVRNGVAGVRWTPDGKKLLYVRENGSGTGNLFILDIEALENRQLTFDKGSFPNDIEITPDGKSAVFGSNRTGNWHIWQIDLDGDNLRQLTDSHGEINPEISNDGKWLYYTITYGIPHTLWKQPLAGGEPTKVLKGVGGITMISPTNSDEIASYYFDPDEKVKSPHQIVLFSEKNPDDLTNLEIPPVHQFEWKPDGTAIYFGDGGESFNNLWSVSTKDKSRTQITNYNDLKIWNMDISPDGKTFAVSRGDATGKIFKISGFDKN